MPIRTERISQTGLRARLVASITFPVGIEIVDFADDADPVDVTDIDVLQTAMGLNGNLLVWSSPIQIEPVLSVIPGSRDDVNLSVLLEANRVGAGKQSAEDSVNLTISYFNGDTVNLLDGVIMSGAPFTSVSSDKRGKSKSYKFAFSNANYVRAIA